MHQVVKNIINIRKQLNYSQEYVSDKIGLNRSTYARFEGSNKKIDLQLIEKIAKEVFNMDLDEVMNFHKNKQTVNEPPVKYNTLKGVEKLKEAEKEIIETTAIGLLLRSKDEVIEALKEALSDKNELIKTLKSKLSN